MQIANQGLNRLRQPIVLPFRPVREGIREVSDNRCPAGVDRKTAWGAGRDPGRWQQRRTQTDER